ncbi:MAG: divalent-cation tolerance protein CutA [Candidatus Omnitrophica bacterium]|nr:divalent-cation tolerance protein CutA [Candidatus Omnitrophota bacterium]
MSCLVVLVSAPSLRSARKISSQLLEKKLAACVTLVPSVESHYVWRGKKEKSREVLLIIKTMTSYYLKLEESIKKLHSYSVPEIIAFPIKRGSRDYLKWIFSTLHSSA